MCCNSMKDEETDLAILLANLKGTKKKDWFATAKACRRLLRRYHNSYKQVAEQVKVSSEIVREVDSINDLPTEAKQILLSDGKGLDKAYRISTKIEGAKNQVEVAKAVADLGAHDARKVIEYVVRNPELSIKKCKEKVMNAKTTIEKIYAVFVSLNESDFKKLKEKSRKMRTDVNELAKQIIKEWIERNDK